MVLGPVVTGTETFFLIDPNNGSECYYLVSDFHGVGVVGCDAMRAHRKDPLVSTKNIYWGENDNVSSCMHK